MKLKQKQIKIYKLTDAIKKQLIIALRMAGFNRSTYARAYHLTSAQINYFFRKDTKKFKASTFNNVFKYLNLELDETENKIINKGA